MANDSTGEIIWRQALLTEGVLSVQQLSFPAGHHISITPTFVLESYMKHVQRITLHLVQPRLCSGGLGFFILFTSIPLIRFSSPRETGPTSLTLPIIGGALVVRGKQGEFAFKVERVENRPTIEIHLDRFHPAILGEGRSRLRKFLYRYSQALIHRHVTVLFLQHLFHELEGKDSCINVRREIFPGEEQI